MEDDRQLVRIICCINEDYSLSICGGKIVFVVADRRDRYQLFLPKEPKLTGLCVTLSCALVSVNNDRHGTSRKDSEGQPAFALVNHATHEAIKHCPEYNQVSLIPYNPDSVDEVLWTMPKDMEQGFTHIRRMDDISLLFTSDRHIVHEAIVVHLCHFANIEKSQRWKIMPYAGSLTMDLGHYRPVQPTVKIYCKTKVGYNLTVYNDAVMMALANRDDKYQHWIKETTHCQHVKDEEKRAAFALVNKATGKALKHSFGHEHLVRLAPFNRNSSEVSLLWTESNDMENGFRQIRMITNTSLVLDAMCLHVQDWALLIMLRKNDHNNQSWKIEEIK